MGRGGFRNTKPFGQVKSTTTKSHVSSGALTGPGSSLSGASAHAPNHSATSGLVGAGSSLSGTATRTRTHNAVAVLLGGGSGLSGTANRTAGGSFLTHNATGTLVGAGASLSGAAGRGLGMEVGMNLSTPYYTSAPAPFANLMWNVDAWVKLTDYSFYTSQDQGTITGAGPTEEFVAIIDNGTGTGPHLPAGTYSFDNPGGNEIAFGTTPATKDIVTSAGANYQTATSGTFTLTENSGLSVYCKGNRSDASGLLRVFLPGHSSADIFNSAYISFHQTLGTQFVRVMDFLNTNYNIAATWADRSQPNKTFLAGPSAGMPYEIAIALANALSKPLWLNVPIQANDAHVTSLAALLAASYTLPILYVEYGNESWNDRNIFQMNHQIVTHLEHTRTTVAVDAATGLITWPGHGKANNSRWRTFTTMQNRANGVLYENPYYIHAWGFSFASPDDGSGAYLKSISADTFELWNGPGGTGTKMSSLPTGVTHLMLIQTDEAGKTKDLHGFHAKRSKQIWDIMDAALAGKVKAVMAGQHANTGVTTDRMANPTYAGRVDYFATAPYWGGETMGARVTRASNSFQVGFWTSSEAPVTCYFGVYPQGTTPTDNQLKTGVGGGVIAHDTFSQAWVGTTNYTDGTAKAVVNGTTYTCWAGVMDNPEGRLWRWSQDIAAANVTDVVDFLDDYENQSIRAKTSYADVLYAQAQAHIAIVQAAKPAAQLIAYEGGNHQDKARPAAINAWWELWWESAYGAQPLKSNLYTAASGGFKKFAYFTDQQSSGPWGLADHTYDTADLRFDAVSSFAGYVPVAAVVDVANVTGSITADPASFPHTAYTFADATLTYQLITGDGDDNFSVTGNVVSMKNDNNVVWANLVTRTLLFKATNGQTDSFFTLEMTIGVPDWFALDAHAAWLAKDDTNNAVMNQVRGSNIALISGTGAVIDGNGHWDMNAANNYGAGGCMTGTIAMSTPFGFMWCGRKDDQTVNGAELMRFGVFPFIMLMSGNANVTMYIHDGSAEWYQDIPWDNTLAVHWVYVDLATTDKIHYGKNQTDISAGGINAASMVPGTIGNSIDIPSANNDVVWAGYQIINRTGMTLANFLAEVQKLQTEEGIA
jgi:hypothetical protein